nr:conjugal transfer protein TraF [Clostridium gasigenes]
MFIVALVGGGIVTLAGVKIYKSIDDIKHIKYNEILKLNEEKYLVYFYEEDNEICINIEPDIVKYSKKTSIPMYVVNMSNNENKEVSKKIDFYIDNSNKEKINITSSPEMYLVEDGKIVDYKDSFIDMMGLIGRFYIN